MIDSIKVALMIANDPNFHCNMSGYCCNAIEEAHYIITHEEIN